MRPQLSTNLAILLVSTSFFRNHVPQPAFDVVADHVDHVFLDIPPHAVRRPVRFVRGHILVVQNDGGVQFENVLVEKETAGRGWGLAGVVEGFGNGGVRVREISVFPDAIRVQVTFHRGKVFEIDAGVCLGNANAPEFAFDMATEAMGSGLDLVVGKPDCHGSLDKCFLVAGTWRALGEEDVVKIRAVVVVIHHHEERVAMDVFVDQHLATFSGKASIKLLLGDTGDVVEMGRNGEGPEVGPSDQAVGGVGCSCEEHAGIVSGK